ncbi:MAG: S1 RNA-binding domain-containing protein [Planctomycetota bacterium]
MDPISESANDKPTVQPEITPQEDQTPEKAAPTTPPGPTDAPAEAASALPEPAPSEAPKEADAPFTPRRRRRPEPAAATKPLTPAELAASLSGKDDKDLDLEVEAAMQGVSEAEMGAATVTPPSAEEPVPDSLMTGRVANVGSDDILIDFDGKSLGTMPLSEADSKETYAVGDSVEVYVVGKDKRSGLYSVSRRKAKRAAILRDLKVGLVVEGRVVAMNRGGLEVNVDGLHGFIPASQVDLHFMKDISDLIGETVRLEITRFEVDGDRENLVFSRRKVLMREEAEQKEAAIQSLEEGQTRQGIVRNVTDYGAFVDIGGIDGLLHVTDMSWGRIDNPGDLVKVGDKIEVKVIKVNKQKKKISLSLKQTTPNPWDTAGEKYTPNTKLHGRVVRLESFGAFVEIEPGLDGLLPISELSWTRRIRHPSEVVKPGDIVEVSVLTIDPEKKRISLSLKQLCDDPWTTAAERYVEGAKIKGKVARTTDFGAFVQLEEGIDGLVHISEIAEERIRQVTDKVKAGDEVEVRVLSVDPEAKKVSLSMKPETTAPSTEALARMEAERAAERKRKPSKPRRGGITYDWDGGLTLGGLDPSKFGS